jgi:hypothetical protein
VDGHGQGGSGLLPGNGADRAAVCLT